MRESTLPGAPDITEYHALLSAVDQPVGIASWRRSGVWVSRCYL